MIIRYPGFYRNFHCTADACPDTCCAGWNIHMDAQSLKLYQAQKGPFGRKLRKSICKKSGCFKMEGRRCRMLTEEGLCAIQQNLGEAALCKTCKTYPRHMEAYPGRREYMLMLSCPEAARMILSREAPVKFYEKEVPESEKERKEKGWDERDQEEQELLDMLCRVRKTVEAFLTDRTESPEKRAGMMLALCHDVQNFIERNQEERIEEVCAKFEGKKEQLKKQIARDQDGRQGENRHRETRQELRVGYLKLLTAWEPITDTWPEFYEEYCQILEKAEEKRYQRERAGFEEVWKSRFPEAAEQILMCFQFTYLLGACYDRNLWGKAVLTVYSYLLIKELCFGIWLETGTVRMEDLIETVHLYSRECEHSDRNLEILEELFVDRKLFSIERLLYALGEER